MPNRTIMPQHEVTAKRSSSVLVKYLFGRRKTDLPPEEEEEIKHAGESLLWKILIYSVLFLVSVVVLLVSYNVKPHLVLQDGEIIAANIKADLGASFLKDLGIAGLVAIFLAITFERLSAQEFEKIALREQNRIKHDVFRYVYGHDVPEDIRKEIHAKVLTSKFVRDKISLSYTLTPLIGASGRFMQVDVVAKCAVRNLTNRPEQYRVSPSVEKPPVPEFADRAGFRFLEITGSREPLGRVSAEELETRNFIERDDISIGLKPPHPIVMPRTPTIITVAFRSVTHLDGGYDYFMFADHTCKTRVVVRVPDNDYTVALRDFGGEELAPHPVWHQPDEGRFHWEAQTPILKNQGIYITWSPRNEAKPEAQTGRATEIL